MQFRSMDLVSSYYDASPPVALVSLTDIKAHLRIDTSEEDAYLTSLVLAATKYCENRTKRAFLTQQWVTEYDCLSVDEFTLPRPPLQSVDSITYVDSNNETQTLSSSLYRVDNESEPGRVVWNPDVSIPTGTRVRITHNAGYGNAATAVPEDIIHAVKLLVGHWYMHREPVHVGNTVNPIPFAVDALLDMHQAWV